MKNSELNKFDVQEMNSQEMEGINGGKAAYIWHDNDPTGFWGLPDALYNGGAYIYNLFA